jgi:hypothetical protein
MWERQDAPSYGDDEGPWISTSKYRRLSSWGTALIPGTLFPLSCQMVLSPGGGAMNGFVRLGHKPLSFLNDPLWQRHVENAR